MNDEQMAEMLNGFAARIAVCAASTRELNEMHQREQSNREALREHVRRELVFAGLVPEHMRADVLPPPEGDAA